MTRLSTLTRLRDMVRNADGPNAKLDTLLDKAALERGVVRLDPFGDGRLPGLTKSLEACCALTIKLLPECSAEINDIGPRHTAHIKWEGLEAAAYGNTRPLAILDCLLSVLIEKEGRE